MDAGVVNIGYVELVCASLLMLVSGIISFKLKLGLEKRILIATVRAFLQLLACGFLLGYLFKYQSWWLCAIVLVCMVIAATQISTERVQYKSKGIHFLVFVSIFSSSVTVAFIILFLVIKPEPWYSARQVIPISGMIIGNAMSHIAVALNRMFSDLDFRRDEMYSMIATGASAFEAAFPSIKQSISAGMTPVLSQMCAAGIVSIPGMMSGQILAGAVPVDAAKYQIVVLLMLSAANTIAIVLACFLTYKKRFSKAGYFLEPGIE